MELVIASGNTQKVLEIRQILKDLAPRATILSLFDFPSFDLPPYDPAQSLAENAQIKARHAANELNKVCLSEQWGLILPALGDAQSKLFEKEGARLQTKEILQALEGRGELDRSAYIESAMALVSPEGKERLAIGRTEGLIAESERGKGSSDFDSIFIKHDYIKTLAELSPSVRSRISSRRKALEKLAPYFESARS
jgi:XTP/dITP diphosphohydrolase